MTLVFLRGGRGAEQPMSFLELPGAEQRGGQRLHSQLADVGCGFIDSTLSH